MVWITCYHGGKERGGGKKGCVRELNQSQRRRGHKSTETHQWVAMLSFRNKKQDSSGEHVEEGGGPHGVDSKVYSSSSKSPSTIPFPILQVFSLDLRSLALFRVMLAAVVIVDLMNRSGSMFAHYANLGVWPVVEAINNINPHSFSFHFSNGNISFLLRIEFHP